MGKRVRYVSIGIMIGISIPLTMYRLYPEDAPVIERRIYIPQDRIEDRQRRLDEEELEELLRPKEFDINRNLV